LQLEAGKNRMIGMFVAVGAIIALIAASIAWLAARSLARPINAMVHVAENLAHGDIKQRVTYRRGDEIGGLASWFRAMIAYQQQMAAAADHMAAGDLTAQVKPASADDLLGHAFSRMVSNLRRLVNDMTQAVSDVSQASTQLSTAATQSGQVSAQIADTMQSLAVGATQQTQSATRTADSVNQIGRVITGVTQGAQEQAGAVAQSALATGQLAETIRQLFENVAQLQAVREKVGASALKVNQMGRHSQQIGAIVQTIDEIASQTNLLALNAAIEAARAGEHGKGFAVVADEVRKLSERASDATGEITTLIQSVQAVAGEAVSAMDESAVEVDEQVSAISAATREMNVYSRQLIDAMGTVSAVVEENTAATEQMSAGSGQMLHAIEDIASVSQENSAAAEEVSAATEEMSAQVNELKDSVQQMRDTAKKLQSLMSRFALDQGGASGPNSSTSRPHVSPVEKAVAQPSGSHQAAVMAHNGKH
jgi:methyl-accepting chemotaxis protein